MFILNIYFFLLLEILLTLNFHLLHILKIDIIGFIWSVLNASGSNISVHSYTICILWLS